MLIVSLILVAGFMLVMCLAKALRLARGNASFSRALLCLGVAWAVMGARGEGLDALLNQEAVTPDDVAHVCAHYAFELNPTLQAPETFLDRKRGDCADFSNLASIVLNHWGYHTKLVVVMMAKQTHVVCYVKEVGGFLDYNHRADLHPVIPSDGSLEDIAAKVCRDFHSEWHLASAFRYQQGSPYYLDTTFPIDESAAKMANARSRANSPQPSFAAQAIIP